MVGGLPSAKLGMVAVVSNTTAASTSRSLFTAFLLCGTDLRGLLCTSQRHTGKKPWIRQVSGKSKFSRFGIGVCRSLRDNGVWP